MGHSVVRGERFAFDDDVWAEEVHRFRPDRESGALGLRVIAFGERHPSSGRSTYERPRA